MTKFTIEDLRDIAYRGSYDDLERELALQLLSSIEQAPVYLRPFGDDGETFVACDGNDERAITLYSAPQLPQPAPVSVPAAMEMDDDFDSAFEHGKAVGWNACRAVMLQAEPVSNSDELPLDYLQGHKDGLEWAAQLAEGNHPQTGDWLYDDPIELARAIRKGPDMPTVQDGKSPVATGAWIPVSERMPEVGVKVLCFPVEDEPINTSFNGQLWLQDISWSVSDESIDNVISCNVTHWMPLPAAPKEVSK